jgi:hypothetical protein
MSVIFDIVWFDTNLNRFIRLKETMDNGSEYQITGKFIDDYSGNMQTNYFNFGLVIDLKAIHVYQI